MDWQVERIGAGDEEMLWQMLDQAAHVPDDDAARAAARRDLALRRYVEGFGRAGDLGFAARAASGEPALGAAWIRLLTPPDQGYGYLDDETPELVIGVRPAHRGQGLGSAMLRALLAAARGAHPAISLSVRLDNPALRLYRRLGFAVVPGSEMQNRAGGRSVTMRIAL